MRELAEETGLTITVGEVFHVKSGFPRSQVDVYYLCQHHDGDFVPNPEIAEIRFCVPDELPDPMPGEQKRLITLAAARYRMAASTSLPR